MLPLKRLPQRAVAKGIRAARAQRRERSRDVAGVGAEFGSTAAEPGREKAGVEGIAGTDGIDRLHRDRRHDSTPEK